ncbi:MAG: deoxyribodipyrimidine photo-lyase [Bdellovibrionaceae bacterium]|nr:deoxyribodipyrimidine photo-lyase [Pseudobdellovibrionaceae bacterium]MBX3033893.1 deoxyribodipyrimidine photo-lyase [Pseudobdellovibrionaceae bacterium]
MSEITVFWFRRDLRLEDNAGLFHALSEQRAVQPLFIFDTDILGRLEDRDDARVSFLHDSLGFLREALREEGAELWTRRGPPLDVWKKLVREHRVRAVYFNHDDEPAARRRDEEVSGFLRGQGIEVKSSKDQSLFERDEVLTEAGRPYTVFTPYKNKVLKRLSEQDLKPFSWGRHRGHFHRPKSREELPSLGELGFTRSLLKAPPRRLSKALIRDYDKTRDFPALENGTTHLGPHLRFGTVSVRALARLGRELNATWLSELIWRDFFKQILWHHPRVVERSFRPEYDDIAWRNSRRDFERWAEGKTGYPLVDAGMRELNATGFMHNRARMVTASFLCKHLLIHWREGEAYFARRLLDYDLSANNGNWQWAAGSGCDAAPYFRIFNPLTQAKKFDPDGEYIRRWVPEWGSAGALKPLVNHDEARGRALRAYAAALKGAAV